MNDKVNDAKPITQNRLRARWFIKAKLEGEDDLVRLLDGVRAAALQDAANLLQKKADLIFSWIESNSEELRHMNKLSELAREIRTLE